MPVPAWRIAIAAILGDTRNRCTTADRVDGPTGDRGLMNS